MAEFETGRLLTRGKEGCCCCCCCCCTQGSAKLSSCQGDPKDDERSAANLAKHFAKSVRADYVSSTSPCQNSMVESFPGPSARASSMAFAIRENRSISDEATARGDTSKNRLAWWMQVFSPQIFGIFRTRLMIQLVFSSSVDNRKRLLPGLLRRKHEDDHLIGPQPPQKNHPLSSLISHFRR